VERIKMKNLEANAEVDTAFNVLLKELEIDYSELDPETVINIRTAISKSVTVKNSALLYLVCNPNRAELMRERLVRDVLELYERGN
jgi:hypothetical protein